MCVNKVLLNSLIKWRNSNGDEDLNLELSNFMERESFILNEKKSNQCLHRRKIKEFKLNPIHCQW